MSQTDFSNLPFGHTFSDHMFIADYEGGEWKNMRIVPYGDISISPAMSALHYGQSFFEGLKAYRLSNGTISIFRPDKNATRFNESAQRMCMPQLPVELFLSGVSELVKLDSGWVPNDPDSSLYIRPFMFGTDAYLGVRPSNTYKCIIITGPTGPYYSKPLKVKIETTYSRSAEGGFGFAKAAGNYGGSLLPAKLATDEGFDQLIWTDSKDHAYIEEMGTANILFLLDGTLITPSTRDTILDGITRDSIIKLAKSWNIPVEERRVSVAEIIEGAKSGKLTDAFGAGTAATIAPVAEISYNDDLYTLSDVTQREFSNKLFNTLNDIKYGKAADEFGWNYIVS